MTDHTDVPIVATGDWIDAAFINQYWGDNFRSIFQGFANAGSIAYAIDVDTIGELVKPSVDSVLKNTSAGALAWVAMSAIIPTGVVWPFGGTVAPSGFLMCDGSAVSRSTYAALFAEIGTTFGAGDGSTTFNLPKIPGRTIIGAGSGAGLTTRALGATGGEESHALTAAENGPHNHSVIQTNPVALDDSTGTGSYYNSASSFATSTGTSGSGTAHNNMQPFIAMNHIIKT
jgi:microcystin-dependent protein